jgi:hypothetical protein
MLSGSLIGGAIGLVMGAGTGPYQAHAAAEQRHFAQRHRERIRLFPLGDYQKIQAVLGDTEAGFAITVSGNITR